MSDPARDGAIRFLIDCIAYPGAKPAARVAAQAALDRLMGLEAERTELRTALEVVGEIVADTIARPTRRIDRIAAVVRRALVRKSETGTVQG